MEKSARRILKSSDVKLEGRVHLDAAQTGPSPTKGQNVTSAIPQARIVENRPEFAVVEVVCSCGTTTCLRCEYTGAESSAESSQTQNDTVGGPDQEPDQAK